MIFCQMLRYVRGYEHFTICYYVEPKNEIDTLITRWMKISVFLCTSDHLAFIACTPLNNVNKHFNIFATQTGAFVVENSFFLWDFLISIFSRIIPLFMYIFLDTQLVFLTLNELRVCISTEYQMQDHKILIPYYVWFMFVVLFTQPCERCSSL